MEFESIIQYLESLSIAHFVAMGLILFSIILYVAGLGKSRSEKKLLAKAPQIMFKDFQVAPLGKDAFLKLKNLGELATISQLDIIGRADLMVKNDYAGHELGKEKEYRIFLESSGHQKIEKDFLIEITFTDSQGNIYKQVVPVDTLESQKLTIVKRGK